MTIRLLTYSLILLLLHVQGYLFAQHEENSPADPGSTKTLLTPFRLPLPADTGTIRYIDLDHDGDPDVLQTIIDGNIPVQWIDDDDDMKKGDMEGDTDNDCLMIDRNKDGRYGGSQDLIIDWDDEDGDGKADIQVLVENSKTSYKGKWKSHIVYIFDTDHDGIFNYVDWSAFKPEAWDHSGRCRFYQDYMGQSLMLKTHISTFSISDLRYNWENPFLFYDEDHDGYTEMAIRLVDEPENVKTKKNKKERHDGDKYYTFSFTKKISLAQLTFDLDNDNRAGNEFDYDMSLQFSGTGFSYAGQVHHYNSLRGLPAADRYFYDPRWRRLNELIYCGHDTAYRMIFDRGQWSSCWMVFDEDDDCQRWERVEFYMPLDPFIHGANKGGLDNNPQADVSGDRGEWDLDCSGKGNLYISPMDGKLHLLGAETGYWRIDQMALYFQGWQGWRGQNIQPQDMIFEEPKSFATIKYEDTDRNGFFDKMSFDMDGDHKWETQIRLADLGLTDTAAILITSKEGYKGLHQAYGDMANNMWIFALQAMKVADKYHLNTSWYAFLKNPVTEHEKYFNGFWLAWYIYRDLVNWSKANHNKQLIRKINRAYFSFNWDPLLKN